MPVGVYERTKEYRQKMSEVMRGNTNGRGHQTGVPHLANERNPSWKGEEASYTAHHMWVLRHKTKTGICSKCGADRGAMGRGGTHWHSKGHKYLRDLDEWIELCPSCNHWRRPVIE